MKTLKNLKATLLMLCLAAANYTFAIGGGSIMGQVTDPDTKNPVGGIKVQFESQGANLLFETNEQGYYYASNIAPGIYKITVRFMKNITTVTDVKIGNDETRNIDLSVSMLNIIQEIEIDGGVATKPLLDPFMVDTKVYTGDDINIQPIVRLDQVILQEAGVIEMDGAVYVHGSRADGLAYYIDGCKITGNPNIPICGVEMMQVHTGYIPAKWGDTLAGVVAIETRNFFTE